MPAAMTRPPLRIAMWSGPRNISTAMMRAFGSRPDTTVTDELVLIPTGEYAADLADEPLEIPGLPDGLSVDGSDQAFQLTAEELPAGLPTPSCSTTSPSPGSTPRESWTSATTCCAGRRRDRILALSVAASAPSTHS